MLKTGHGENLNAIQANIIRTPQGSALSLLLCNIYRYELDKFIISTKEYFDENKEPSTYKKYYKIALAAIRAQQKGNGGIFKKLNRLQNPPLHANYTSGNYKRLVYARYEDD